MEKLESLSQLSHHCIKTKIGSQILIKERTDLGGIYTRASYQLS
jgi:hypothetical protein